MESVVAVARVLPAPEPASLLTLAQEAALTARIEAGLVAGGVLRGEVPWPADATEHELDAIAAAGQRAREDLVAANVGLVWYVVRPVARRTGQDPGELFQEGMVGLLEALARFDPAIGKFATCALPRIRMRVRDAAITRHGSLGLPARRARQWRRTRAIAADLTVALSRRPTVEEIAEAAAESVSVVRSLLAYVPPVPADTADERPGLAPAAGAATDDLGAAGDREVVAALLGRLDPLDRTILTLRYGLQGPTRTLDEVARVCGRSESTVRRRERLALERLREGSQDLLAA